LPPEGEGLVKAMDCRGRKGKSLWCTILQRGKKTKRKVGSRGGKDTILFQEYGRKRLRRELSGGRKKRNVFHLKGGRKRGKGEKGDSKREKRPNHWRRGSVGGEKLASGRWKRQRRKKKKETTSSPPPRGR